MALALGETPPSLFAQFGAPIFADASPPAFFREIFDHLYLDPKTMENSWLL